LCLGTWICTKALGICAGILGVRVGILGVCAGTLGVRVGDTWDSCAAALGTVIWC